MKTTREIEQEKNSNVMGICLTISLTLFFTLLVINIISENNLQSQIDELKPKFNLGNLTLGNYSYTGVYVSCNNCSNYSDEQKREYIFKGLGKSFDDVFPLFVSINHGRFNATYYNIYQLPVDNVCIDEHNCLWKFDWGDER